ncbi:glycerol-3-phosphate acyltransferase [Thermoflexus sp.]|uniref:glycerol-3-phosphate acyltransferase n=1 Tax=Thermoflexus sp. TaxID=1969742 RepID=UPI0025EF4AC3|nr:glycerol-3-phosphate acyltransferase [Thermoflexus sp.]MCS6965077.1 glycerol-3-phosphate acyltransferase [Thermoflexus sp.]MCS7350710.1 glycerol-3-phosphate acyltransferase [Thermoflexus sp.]MCX7691547.1 glycerol-3-phosphate acyltransferase [Thermoflexus sp.]MDW8180161.1 glycerol-3-phosphate acyltransferase [Anaerolineae bacterium]
MERSVALLLGAYLLGSFPTGWVVVRLLTGQDVRRVGSGRTGGTNAMRAGGLPAGLLTGLGDLLKGALAILLARLLFPDQPMAGVIAGWLAVAGHNWSIWMGFRGGAGTAPNIGAALALWPLSAAVLLPMIPLAAALTGYASLTSMVLALAIPLVFAVRTVFFNGPWVEILYGLGTLGMVAWALRPNFRRLREGTEPRLRISMRPTHSVRIPQG